MSIIRGVFTITRDNAKPNDVMLEEYELATYSARTTTQTLEQPWHFTQKEGDVRCIGHIINLAAQAALTQLKQRHLIKQRHTGWSQTPPVFLSFKPKKKLSQHSQNFVGTSISLGTVVVLKLHWNDNFKLLG
jgi:hypothetical protein